MQCEKCGANPAAVHYKTIVNGVVSETNLCPGCAHELGYDQLTAQPMLGFGLESLLSGMFGQNGAQAPAPSQPGVRECPLCGARPTDITRTGRPGCPNCYTVYAQMIGPTIRRIHGNASHTGRVPLSAGAAIKKRRELADLRARLQSAVEEQEYERAAALRDEIRGIEDGGDGNG